MNDWFEYTVNPGDPTNITLRRLSEDEVRQAREERALEWLEKLSYSFIEAARAGRAFYRQLRAEGLLGTPRGLSPRRTARRKHSRGMKRR